VAAARSIVICRRDGQAVSSREAWPSRVRAATFPGCPGWQGRFCVTTKTTLPRSLALKRRAATNPHALCRGDGDRHLSAQCLRDEHSRSEGRECFFYRKTRFFLSFRPASGVWPETCMRFRSDRRPPQFVGSFSFDDVGLVLWDSNDWLGVVARAEKTLQGTSNVCMVGQTCVICLECGADCYLRCCLSGCVAAFHKDCASQALGLTARCPLCRRLVDDQEVLHATDAFLELREYSMRRYAALERVLTRLLTFIGEAAASEMHRRRTDRACPCRRRAHGCEARGQ